MFIPPEFENDPDMYYAIQASLQELSPPVDWIEESKGTLPERTYQKTPSTGKFRPRLHLFS